MKTIYPTKYHNKMWCTTVFTILLSVLLFSTSQAQVSPNFLINDSVQCAANNHFVFTNTTNSTNTTYVWDFKDGTFDTAFNTTKIFAKAGIYSVTLIATKNNISYYYSQTIIVAPEPHIATIALQPTFNGKSYTFISSSTIDFGYMTYMWNLGDSVSSTLINPVHTYKQADIVNVSLTVTSNYGCVESKSQIDTIKLYDSSVIIPKFNINTSKQCSNNNNFIFKNTTTLDTGTSVLWSFGDGTNATTVNATKTYSAIGKYLVTLSIIKAGITYTCEKEVTTFLGKIAAFQLVQQPDSATYSFSNFSTPNSPTTTYIWSFGDSCFSNQENPIHLFYPGNYTIKLVVKDATVCSDSISKNIVIYSNLANNIVSSFTVNAATQCLVGNSFVFNNTSTSSCNVVYNWSFGDGSFSNQAQPIKQYTVAGNYTVTLNVTIGSTTVVSTKNIVVNNDAIWVGLVSNNWADTANWMCAYPSANSDIIVKVGGFYPNITNTNLSIRNLIVETGASITIANSTLKIAGNIINSGNIDATTATIEFNGTAKQTINGSVNVGNLVINNAAGVDVTSTDTINIYNLLTLKNGAFCTNNLVSLKSAANNTARIDKMGVGGNVGTICGNFIIERYFQDKAAWRFYTSPFTANGNNTNFSINNTWQKFTNVTGPIGTGFDYTTPAYSITSWNETTQKWNNMNNTFTNYIVNNNLNFSNVPYFVFVRGDKTINESWLNSEVTIKGAGTLQTGNQTFNFSGKKSGNYVFVGNPYASPVDLSLLTSQGLNGNFYFYDATLNATGAYVTVSNKGNGNWIITPSNAAQKDKVIQSSQAMLVGVSAASGYVTFTENAKTATGSDFTTFGGSTASIDKLEVNLYKIKADSSKVLLDGAATIFGDGFAKDVDDNDSKKIMNAAENIGFKNGNDILSIEARPFVVGEDSVNIYTGNLSDTTNYAIEVKFMSNDTVVNQLLLKDSLLNSIKNATTKNATWYYFRANNTSNGRFNLVVKSSKNAAGNIINLGAKQVNENINITWDAVEEKSIKNYTVQHSVNNIDFSNVAVINAINANKTNSYAVADNEKRVNGVNYCRVAATTQNDVAVISKSVQVNFTEPNKTALNVYPNPTSGKIVIEYNSTTNQNLQLNITNANTGEVIKVVSIKAKKGANKTTINLLENNVNLSNGVYILKLLGNDEVYKSSKIILVKQ